MRRGLILGAVVCLGAWALPAWGQGGNPPASTKESKQTSGKGMMGVEQTRPRKSTGPDPVKVAPNHYKVLLDNARVRVLDFHASPGDKIPMHSHPGYVVYQISGSGKTKFTAPDGATSELEAIAGTATWRDAETHAAEYLGPGEAHVLIIELKRPAKK